MTSKRAGKVYRDSLDQKSPGSLLCLHEYYIWKTSACNFLWASLLVMDPYSKVYNNNNFYI